MLYVNKDQKIKGGIAILSSDKIDLRDKYRHHIMIMGLIKKENITCVNTYAFNIPTPKCMKQILTNLKGEINSNTIMVGSFNTPPSPMDRSSRQKINKEIK